MITWNNMDTLASYEQLKAVAPVKIQDVMSGEAGADRVKKYTAPMGAGMDFNYGARPVDDAVLVALQQYKQRFLMQQQEAVTDVLQRRTRSALQL